MKRFRIIEKAPEPKPALTRNQVQAIRNSGQSATTLSKQYGVSEKEIRDIQSLKTHFP
jgi:hypothetical protein